MLDSFGIEPIVIIRATNLTIKSRLCPMNPQGCPVTRGHFQFDRARNVAYGFSSFIEDRFHWRYGRILVDFR